MLHNLPPNGQHWRDTHRWPAHHYECGYCARVVSSDQAYLFANQARMFVCPGCGHPSYFPAAGVQIPGYRPGRVVAGLPTAIARLYEESRTSIAAGTFTSAALTLRILLIHIAADRGMKGGGSSYKACVTYLVTEGYVAKKEEDFVDEVRVLGNAANHELGEVTREEAEQALAFMEHLLLGLYEYPQRAAAKKSAK